MLKKILCLLVLAGVSNIGYAAGKGDDSKQTSALTAQATDLNKQIVALKTQIDTLTKQNATLTTQAADLNKQIVASKTQIDTLTKQNAILTTQAADLNKQISASKTPPAATK